MDTLKRTLIVTFVLLAAALCGAVAAQAQDVRHYRALTALVQADGVVQEHFMLDTQQMRAARVIVGLPFEGGRVEQAASGPVTAMTEAGVVCFEIDDVAGAPPEIVGRSFCYLYDSENDSFRQYADGDGNFLPFTLEWCGEDHNLQAPAGYKRGT